MNCPNCGRPLAEGETCNCISNESYVNPNPIIHEPQVNTAPPFEAQAQPYAPQNTYYQPPQSAFYQPGTNPQGYGAMPQPAPAAAPARTDYPEGYKIKRKYVAVILAATLGAFGIHNFYLGNNNRAVAQLLVATVGSLVFGLGLVAAGIWGIVEAVQLLTDKIDSDANGFKIQTFEEALAKELKKKD